MSNISELKGNKLKIISNPYSRTIEYYYWETTKSEWCSPADTSDFKSPRFTNAAIYHKAYDILETALKCYGGNVGIDIFFEGTADDFKYLNEIANKYFHDKEITLIWGSCYLPNVKAVKRDIESKFKDMEDMFQKYPNNSATEKIKRFRDTMSDTIPICVMGLYSTGKSAFINSLLGVEILPSADDPTTAKTFKISVGPKITEYAICFEYQDERTPKCNIKLEFCGEKFKINKLKDNNNDIVSELDKVKEYKSEYDRMYHALSYINEYDKDFKPDKSSKIKWRVSPLIEVSLPLKKSYTSLPIDQYDFVIYDTPGSNSYSNVDHKKVLKDAMKEQTNGLPIYVITSKNMDSDSNRQLMDTFNELGGSLDKNNLMIIVNQADDASADALENKKNNFDSLAVHRLNPAGTYFVSSVMGLGGKLMQTKRTTSIEDTDAETGELKTITAPCFVDLNYQHIFGKNKKYFVGKINPKSLYSYNIVPVPELDNYKSSVKLEDPDDRIYYNSGLDAVGSTITEFSENYSLYNKCRNAGNYLKEAFALLTGEIEEKKKNQEELNQKLNKRLDKKEKQLIDELTKIANEKKKESEIRLENVLADDYQRHIQKVGSDAIVPIAKEILKDCHGFHKKSKFVSRMESYLSGLLSEQWCDFKKSADTKWEEVKKDLKESLIRAIVASPNLTPKQKEFLRDTITNIEIKPNFNWNVNIESNEIASGILLIRIKDIEASKKCREIFDCKTSEARSYLNTKWSDFYDSLWEKLNIESVSCLNKHNPVMQRIKNDIDNCRRDIANLDKQKNQVSDKIREIGELTKFKERNEDEV